MNAVVVSITIHHFAIHWLRSTSSICRVGTQEGSDIKILLILWSNANNTLNDIDLFNLKYSY